MTESRYPRSLIEPLLVRTAFSESYRIMSQRHVGSPLGATPADSRFATRTGGYTVLYAAPDFTTAFIETIVRDRFAHRRIREVALREITERMWVRIAAEPGARLTLLDLRGGCPRAIVLSKVHVKPHLVIGYVSAWHRVPSRKRRTTLASDRRDLPAGPSAPRRAPDSLGLRPPSPGARHELSHPDCR